MASMFINALGSLSLSPNFMSNLKSSISLEPILTPRRPYSSCSFTNQYEIVLNLIFVQWLALTTNYHKKC